MDKNNNATKKYFINYNFLNIIKKLNNYSDISSKKQDFLVCGLLILFYELANHKDKELNKYVNSLESNNNCVKLDFNFIDSFKVLGQPFYVAIKRIYAHYRLAEWINLFYKEVLFLEGDSFYINIKILLLRFKEKNNQYIPLSSPLFIDNIFIYINNLAGKNSQDILHLVALGVLINCEQNKQFALLALSRSVDYNITRQKNHLMELLNLLVQLQGIENWQYINKSNSLIINCASKFFITIFKAKTFIKNKILDLFSQTKKFSPQEYYVFKLKNSHLIA